MEGTYRAMVSKPFDLGAEAPEELILEKVEQHDAKELVSRRRCPIGAIFDFMRPDRILIYRL